ncbi:1414_t:CDS:2, partial [Racocetra persica]
SIADALRFNSVSFNNLYIKVLGFLMRESEKYAASFIGRKYGHYTYRFSNGKSVAGTLGAIT